MTPTTIVESLLGAVGADGTLLLPLFNFGFADGAEFDIRHTPSEMGALTEAGRLYPGAVRTGHPIYSFAAIGAQAPRFAKVVNFSGYGPDSPFALLRELGGKIAVLDLPEAGSMTFYHHAEEMHAVPYRYHKTFRGPYTTWDGETSVREFGLFVRDLEDGVEAHLDPMGELAWRHGLYSGHRAGTGSGLRVASARALYDLASWVITSGVAEGTLYRKRESAR